MDGEDGYDLLRRIRAMQDPAVSVPAVALTALVSEGERKRALEAGFQEFIGKPVDPAKLVSILAALTRVMR